MTLLDIILLFGLIWLNGFFVGGAVENLLSRRNRSLKEIRDKIRKTIESGIEKILEVVEHF